MSERIVGKAPPKDARSWAEDVLLQAEMARRQGLSGPLTVGLDEAAHLRSLLGVAKAAADFCAYHGRDIAPLARERLEKLEAALACYRGDA